MKRSDFIRLLSGLGIGLTELPILASHQINNKKPRTIVILLNGGVFNEDHHYFTDSIKNSLSRTSSKHFQLYDNLNTSFSNHRDIWNHISDKHKSFNRIKSSFPTNSIKLSGFDSISLNVGMSDINKMESLKSEILGSNDSNQILELDSSDVAHYSNKLYTQQIKLQSKLISGFLDHLIQNGDWHINPFNIFIINCLPRIISTDNLNVSHHNFNGNMTTWAIQVSNKTILNHQSKMNQIDELIDLALSK